LDINWEMIFPQCSLLLGRVLAQSDDMQDLRSDTIYTALNPMFMKRIVHFLTAPGQATKRDSFSTKAVE